MGVSLKKILIAFFLNSILVSVHADALVDKTYSITKKDGSAFCQYTIDILATEELLEQEFHTVNLDFDLTKNDGFIIQTYWSPDSKRSWIPINDLITDARNIRKAQSLFKTIPEQYFVILNSNRNTISLPEISALNTLVDPDGSSWIRIVLFIPQSC